MATKYKLPMEVQTSTFKPCKILSDLEGFVIAENIAGRKACRWHQKDNIGYPNGYGKPQWFLLPEGVGINIEMSL